MLNGNHKQLKPQTYANMLKEAEMKNPQNLSEYLPNGTKNPETRVVQAK